MRGPAIIALALATGCEARVGGNLAADGTPADDDGSTGDGPAPDAPLGAFGAPQKITIAADDTAREDDGTLSHDGLELVFVTRDCLTVHFASTRLGPNKIFTSKRAAIGQPWSPPVEVDTFAALGGAQQDPFISDDTRIFMFVSDADGTNDLYISTR